MKAPAKVYNTFSVLEMNMLTNTHKDFWGISLMRWFRTLQEGDGISILHIQRYLQSMNDIDVKIMKEYWKKITPLVTFQDVARREMARENRESLKKGIDIQCFTQRDVNTIRSTTIRRKIIQNA